MELASANQMQLKIPLLVGGLEHVFHILGILILTDFHFFFRGVGQPPTRLNGGLVRCENREMVDFPTGLWCDQVPGRWGHPPCSEGRILCQRHCSNSAPIPSGWHLGICGWYVGPHCIYNLHAFKCVVFEKKQCQSISFNMYIHV